MKRHSSNWKSVERKVAKKLGGMRIPLSGSSNMGKIGDVELKGYHIEVKSGRQVPKTVTGWLETLRALTPAHEHGLQCLFSSDFEDCLGPNEIPILVMQPFHKKEMVVAMMLSDLSRMIGKTFVIEGETR